jgi:exopolysaccharide/PEP-CTERM locus tyrosine autokinase
MSIIERVVQLLEPDVQATPRPFTNAKAPRHSELDLIERAIDQSNARSRSAGPGEPVMTPAAKLEAPEGVPGPMAAETLNKARRSSRTLAVDLAKLRQRGIIAPGGERSATAESFRRIKRRILSNAVNPKRDVPANLVLVTSALAGEGKTFCAINLAISIALEVDHSVLLVDADVRKPSIPEVLGLKADKGLMDLLVDPRMDMADVLYRTGIGKLTLLSAGTPQRHANELLASGAMRDLLTEMAARYRDRIIIFDSPPLLLANEAGVLASRMGQVVMVVESGKTTESAVKDALAHIDPSHLTGLVLNKGTAPGLGGYYGGYGNGP